MISNEAAHTAGQCRHYSIVQGALDHLFQRYMEPYQSYIEDTRVFDDSRAAQTLSPAGIRCPGFSYSIFEHCMTYAINNNWGRTLGL